MDSVSRPINAIGVLESSWLILLKLAPSIAARQAERLAMPSLGESTHVIIIRAWLEPREIPGASPQWRFSIQEVGHDELTYLQDFEALSAFMQAHLGICRSPARWRRRLRLLLARQRGEAGDGPATGNAP